MPYSQELFKRIKREIDKIHVVDLHSHLRVNQPNAQNLGEIIFYHLLKWELVSAGMPEEKFTRDISGLGELSRFSHSQKLKTASKIDMEQVISKYSPYFQSLRNTTTYYCLTRIFEDLYDFDFQRFAPNNWRSIFSKVLKTKDDDEWTKHVLLKKAKIDISVTGLWSRSPTGKWIKQGVFSPTLEKDFFNPGLFVEIETLSKTRITSAKSLDKCIDNFLNLYLSKGVTSFTGGFLMDSPLDGISKGRVDSLLKKGKARRKFTESEERELHSYILRKMMDKLNEKGFVWIVALGVVSAGGSRVIVNSSFEVLPRLCGMFRLYQKSKFFLMLGSESLSQELCIIAKQFPNVYPCGFWWHNKYFTYIEKMIAERLDVLPMNRPIGFFSDAYTTEWSYGVLSMIKYALTKVLAQRIDEGLYDEDLAIEIARKWLYENPRDAYFGKNDG